MPKIEKLTVEKSVTIRFGIEADVTDLDTEKDLETTKDNLSKKVDDWLEQEQLALYTTGSLPSKPSGELMFDFNPEELMEHKWKGKKKAEGEYADGSLAWGWDFADNFSENVIQALSKGPVTIDQYEFSLQGSLVQTQKVK